MPANPTVKSAQRALEVVELLEKLHRPVSVVDVATRLGYPQSSTSVLLSGLRRLGYLQYDGATRCYSLSLRVALIGSGLRFGGQSTSSVFEFVNYVREITQLSAAIVTRSEIHMQYVYTIPGAEIDLVGYKPGHLLPLCRTAGGLALLAGHSDNEIGKIVRRINAEGEESVPLQLDAVMADIETVRTQGYICVSGRVFPNVGSVAIPLPFEDICGFPLAMTIGGKASMLATEGENLAMTMGDAVGRFGWDNSGLPSHGRLSSQEVGTPGEDTQG